MAVFIYVLLQFWLFMHLKAHFQIYPFIRWLKPILIDDEKKNSSHCCWYFLSPLEERSAFLSQVLSPIFHPKRKTDEKWPQKPNSAFHFVFGPTTQVKWLLDYSRFGKTYPFPPMASISFGSPHSIKLSSSSVSIK